MCSRGRADRLTEGWPDGQDLLGKTMDVTFLGRRRIGMGESWRKACSSAVEGPGLEGGDTDWLAGRLLAPLVAAWFWIVGEPGEHEEPVPD